MAVQLDLRPNRSLLNAKFESYRLTLDPLPVLKQRLNGGVQRVELGEDQYGYLQQKISSSLNHLFQDPIAPECVFFVSEALHICWICLSQDGRLSEVRVVWQIPVDSGRPVSNCTISFPGADWALVSDGSGGVYLLNTPLRAEGEPWQLCYTHRMESYQTPCYLLHSIYRCFPSSHQVDLLLAHICKPQDVKGNVKLTETTVHFVCVLEWRTLSCGLGNETSSWSVKRQRRLVGNSIPEYAAIEITGSAVCIAAEREFSFFYDSLKLDEKDEPEQKKDSKVSDAPLYTYIQSLENITVVFRIPEGLSKSDLNIQLQPSHIEVSVKGKMVLKGNLWGDIDTTNSTWYIEGQKLELFLTKVNGQLVWHELVKGDTRGEEIMDPALVEEMHNRLAHLISDNEDPSRSKPPYNPHKLEECDTCSEIFTFVRLDGNSHKVTHQINMGGHQWLFSTLTCLEALPTMCLRHDVDGIVWQPKNVVSEGENEQFRVEHVATFPALGYVQASKQDKKFALGSPNFHYAVLCDNGRHIYIYRQPESLHAALALRNRKTGEEVSRIAKQHVINLEQCDSILGLQASKECIFVLSKNLLYAIKVGEG